jgi:hypothetical protein
VIELDLVLERDAESPSFIWIKHNGEFTGTLTPYALDKLGIELKPGEKRKIKWTT